jgi:DNA (cytosine-5)-methyltransferase 1
MRSRKQSEFSKLRQKARLTIEEAADFLEVSRRSAYRYEDGGRVPKLALRTLREHAEKQTGNPVDASFRFIDLFAGIGGLRFGFESIGGRCVFTSEWDPNAQKTYALNFVTIM